MKASGVVRIGVRGWTYAPWGVFSIRGPETRASFSATLRGWSARIRRFFDW